MSKYGCGLGMKICWARMCKPGRGKVPPQARIIRPAGLHRFGLIFFPLSTCMHNCKLQAALIMAFWTRSDSYGEPMLLRKVKPPTEEEQPLSSQFCRRSTARLRRSLSRSCASIDLLIRKLFQCSLVKMKKGIHPQMQWISYVTQSGRLMPVMMTKIHQVGKVYHFRARRQMAESIGQIAKFKRRYEKKEEEIETEKEK
nr:Histone H4 [Ipomoea batatas]